MIWIEKAGLLSFTESIPAINSDLGREWFEKLVESGQWGHLPDYISSFFRKEKKETPSLFITRPLLFRDN